MNARKIASLLVDNIINSDELKREEPLKLKSLPLCLIEMVYSLRIQYDVTNKVCLGYCGRYEKEKYLEEKNIEKREKFAK